MVAWLAGTGWLETGCLADRGFRCTGRLGGWFRTQRQLVRDMSSHTQHPMTDTEASESARAELARLSKDIAAAEQQCAAAAKALEAQKQKEKEVRARAVFWVACDEGTLYFLSTAPLSPPPQAHNPSTVTPSTKTPSSPSPSPAASRASRP